MLRYNDKQRRQPSNGAGRNPGRSKKPFGHCLKPPLPSMRPKESSATVASSFRTFEKLHIAF
jgi:hypothetical protein